MTVNTKYGIAISLWSWEQRKNETLKRLNLCFCFLTGGPCADQCKLKRSCGEDGCTRRHNRLLHRDANDQANSQLTEYGANPVLTADASSGILQVVSVRLSNGVNSVDTLAVCDTGSILSFIGSGIKSSLSIHEKNLTLSVAGMNDTKDITSESLGKSICEQLLWNCDSSCTSKYVFWESQVWLFTDQTKIQAFEGFAEWNYMIWKLSSDKIFSICLFRSITEKVGETSHGLSKQNWVGRSVDPCQSAKLQRSQQLSQQAIMIS